MAVRAETPTVKTRHVPSTRIGSVVPMASAPPVSGNRPRVAHQATASPAAPPSAESTRLSMTSCRTSRNRVAPSEVAERKLRAPPEAARHQQAREVHAGNDEHHRDDGHQESKRGPSFHDQVVVQRGDEYAVAFVERILRARAARRSTAISARAASIVTPGFSRP